MGRERTSSRSENSLYMLTKKFLDILMRSPSKTIDLNQAAIILGVSKRRIYDITNILEGLGFIKKQVVNSAIWINDKNFFNIENIDLPSIDELQVENAAITNQIDKTVASIQNLTGSDSLKEYAFVSSLDLQRIPSLRDQMVFAVKAPQGSEMEIPNTTIKGEYTIRISNEDEKIEAFYVNDED